MCGVGGGCEWCVEWCVSGAYGGCGWCVEWCVGGVWVVCVGGV